MDTILVTAQGQWVWLDEVLPEHVQSDKWIKVKIGEGWQEADVSKFVNEYLADFLSEDGE